MAFVNTGDNQETIRIENDSHVVRLIQGLMADECGAAALYSKIIDSLKGTIANPEIVERLEEIRRDELNHAGSLLHCISLLDNETMLNYSIGYDGDEGGQND